MSIYTDNSPISSALSPHRQRVFVLDDNMLAGRFSVCRLRPGWASPSSRRSSTRSMSGWPAQRTNLTAHHTPFRQRRLFYYAAGFTAFLVARLLTIVALAYSNRYTCPLPPCRPTRWQSRSSSRALPVLLGAQALRLQARLRHRPFRRFLPASAICQTGIFRLTGNAMYVFGFFVLWTPGLFFLSQAALLAAAFNHLYIWVHYYCTSADIRHIYGQDFGKEYGKDLLTL